MNSPVANDGKTAAIVAYFTIVGTIIAYFINNDSKNPFASFHIRQALGIHLAFYLLGALVSIFDNWMITYSFWIFILVLGIYGLITAIQGEQRPIPLLGEHFQKWFSTIH
ncbi:hypothetical protein SAMN04487764_2365 [Gillisia sp. Hel1_33_143]|uniref:DUF4870 domain-containing protein n=1 Tax=Gillisia sp. Hel1_33_143 TaxID=1336796 RepID=UPI00087BAFF4|nr:hypothetical protein [Gillisia sp. Hel1_33_143]SDS50277.1 hypothetical protein SAMN04487764_2365 [Gillisia sp. Hel1_33_143]